MKTKARVSKSFTSNSTKKLIKKMPPATQMKKRERADMNILSNKNGHQQR